MNVMFLSFETKIPLKLNDIQKKSYFMWCKYMTSRIN